MLCLNGEEIYLRPLKAEDVNQNYINGINDPEVNKYLVDVRLNRQTYESIVNFVEYNWREDSCILFGIFYENKEKKLVGTTRISGINWYHYNASVGICLFDKTIWNKGLASQAVELVKKFLFNNLSLHYIEAGAYAINQASIKMFQRAGFREAYRVKNKYRLINTFEEVVYLAAINNGFKESSLKDTF